MKALILLLLAAALPYFSYSSSRRIIPYVPKQPLSRDPYVQAAIKIINDFKKSRPPYRVVRVVEAHFPENIMRGLLPFVVIVIGAAGQRSTVDMKILVDGTADFFKTVTFTEKLFTQFHQCLCTDTIHNCTATFSRDDQHIVQSVDNTRQAAGQTASSSLFRCIINNHHPDNVMNCTRSQQCTTSRHSTSYRLLTPVDSCSFSCIGFEWKAQAEMLDTNIPGFMELNQCTDHCSNTTGTSGTSTHRTSTKMTTPAKTTTPPPTTAMTKANTKITTTDNSRNTTMTSETNTGTSDDNTGVIIGAVVGTLLAIIIAVILVFIILRQRRQSTKSNTANQQTSSIVESASNNFVLDISHHYVSHPMSLPQNTSQNAAHYIDKNTEKKDQYSVNSSSNTTAHRPTPTKMPSNDKNTDADKYYSVAKALDDNSGRNIRHNRTGQVTSGHLNKKTMKTHDEFGYAQVQNTEKTFSATDSQDKQKTANHLTKHSWIITRM